MARFLFVVPPLVGHVNPTVAVGNALQSRGHQVAWVGHLRGVAHLLPAGAKQLELPESAVFDRPQEIRARAESLRGFAAFKQLWEEFFLPLAREMLPGVEAATRDYQPDALLVDQQTFAGGLVARRLGLRWATLATTSARWKESLELLPKVREWLEDHLIALQREAGLDPVADLSLSDQLLIVFSSQRLVGGTFPPQTRFVGPALSGRQETASFPWEKLLPLPRLYVSLGTLNAERGQAFYQLLTEAFASEAIQVIVAAPPSVLPNPRANFIVHAPLPQLALLKHVQAVLCHGGHNTVCEALAQGLPLLAMPIRDDQPVIAQQIVAAGCGLRLRFGRTSATELRTSVARVLQEPAFRESAAAIQASFTAAGGASAAAEAIEGLV